jgi:aminomethyltransferase
LELKKTHIYEYHKKQGNIVDFGGFAMPVWYKGIKEEHNAVRESCGIFDTSHMGRTWVKGKDAVKYLDYIVTNEVNTLNDLDGMYTVMCNPKGGIIDDLILYKLNPEKFLFVYNASNREKDFNWLKKNTKGFEVEIENISDNMAMIAVQGPNAQKTLTKFTKKNLDEVNRFKIAEANVSGFDIYLARTGYTGEDGFELYVTDTTIDKPDKALKIWNDLVEAGATPCGLGSRDSLRLGAGLWLYGNDIDESTNPIEAGLSWTVKLNKKGYFIGQRAIQEIKEKGPERRLVGIKLEERGIPRHGYPIYNIEKDEIGVVTSGGLSPTLGEGIAMGYVGINYRKRGTEVYIKIHGKLRKGKVVKYRPFYDETEYGFKRDKK